MKLKAHKNDCFTTGCRKILNKFRFFLSAIHGWEHFADISLALVTTDNNY